MHLSSSRYAATCTWPEIRLDSVHNSRGLIPEEDEKPHMDDTPTPAQILIYRRWFALQVSPYQIQPLLVLSIFSIQAIRQLNLHYDSVAEIMNEAMLFEQTQLGTFSEIIYGKPPAPTSKGFDLTKLLSLVKAVAGAFPYGTAITAAIDAGEYRYCC